MKLRPLSGRSVICFSVSVWLMLPLSAWMDTVDAWTSTVSVISPSDSVRSTRILLSVKSWMPTSLAMLKPCSSADTAYVAGCRLGNT